MNEITIAIIAFGGTLAGTFGGIVTSAKLTNFRIAQLEKRVEQHNSFAVEIASINGKIENVNRRINDILEDKR